MRVAYLECFSGISGDMILWALRDAGVSEELLQRSVAALKIGAELRVCRVDRSGITSMKIDVLVNGKDAERVDHSHDDHEDAHTHDHLHSHHDAHGHTLNSPTTMVTEKTESAADYHTQSHSHQHGRSLSEIKNIIRAADVPQRVRDTAVRAFEFLGEAE